MTSRRFFCAERIFDITENMFLGGGKYCLFAYQSLSVSQLSQSFFFGISGIKCVQDKIFGIFYVQIHENLQICTDFSEISLSKNQKKVIFARNR